MGFPYSLRARASAFLPGVVLDKTESTENSPSVLPVAGSPFLQLYLPVARRDTVTAFEQKVQHAGFCRICRINVEMGMVEQGD